MPRLLAFLCAMVFSFIASANDILPIIEMDDEATAQLSTTAQAEVLKRCLDAGYSQTACDVVMGKISNKTEKWLSIGQLARDPDYGLDSEYSALPKLFYNAKPNTENADILGNKKPEQMQFVFTAEPMVDKGFWQIGMPYKFTVLNPNLAEDAKAEPKDLHRFRIELACRPNGLPIYDEVKECRLIMRKQISPLTTDTWRTVTDGLERSPVDDAATVWQVNRIIRFPNGLSRQQVFADQCQYADSDLGKTKQDRLIALLPEWRHDNPASVKPVYAWRLDYAGNIFPIQSTGLQCTRCWSCELNKQLGYFLNPYTDNAKLKNP